MRIAILAVQGAFREHAQMLEMLGVPSVELRKKEDFAQAYDGLILPGGESTVQGKMLRELDMFATVKDQIQMGMPVLATCAGMVLLAEEIDGEEKAYLQTIPMVVKRNAYGRQLGSFCIENDFKGVGTVPMTFIRAPYVSAIGENVEILAKENDHIAAVRYGRQIALAFHPELCQNPAIHKLFLSMVNEYMNRK